ncbi:Putative cyclase [Macrophomina phaseolina MS6]|uniref:Putative cyclase n=1 Tax=Macrophomina phaseolina (strain MS6) TaxID=1126212 RepID=K2SXQ9_MACPH|nr:Putative cyclase [Macrophomina phaseolina MS6]
MFERGMEDHVGSTARFGLYCLADLHSSLACVSTSFSLPDASCHNMSTTPVKTLPQASSMCYGLENFSVKRLCMPLLYTQGPRDRYMFKSGLNYPFGVSTSAGWGSCAAWLGGRTSYVEWYSIRGSLKASLAGTLGTWWFWLRINDAIPYHAVSLCRDFFHNSTRVAKEYAFVFRGFQSLSLPQCPQCSVFKSSASLN